MILLYREITRFLPGPFDLVLPLDDHGKTGCLSRVSHDVPCIVVAKHQRGAKVAAEGMVTEVVHFGAAYFAIVAEGRAGRARAEQGNTQPELEGSAKLVGLQCETKTWNRVPCGRPMNSLSSMRASE